MAKSKAASPARANGKRKAKADRGKPMRDAAMAIAGVVLGLPSPHAHAGQPTSYKPEYAKTAKAMCKLGATDFDLAEEFGVKTQTIWNWRCKHKEFFEALLEGKEAFDDKAERSLAMKAVGYTFHSEKVFSCEGVVTRADTIEHVPPDVGALKMWLGNRRPDKWKDKQEVNLSGGEAFLAALKIMSEQASS